jgi:ABC-2 type transport system ATP-binding protein
MIDTNALCKNYGAFAAVQDLTFKAEAGEILGFLGPNGAGKTTTMRMLTGYMPPTRGAAKVAGFDIYEQSLQVRQNVGYLPETVPLYPDMTVQGYLRYIAELRGLSRTGLADRVTAMLKLVDMNQRRHSLIRNISKGMRQRVGLAQALIHDPAVLILDEPTIGLDPIQTVEVRDMVRAMGKARTVMFSTHILSEAEQVCDRVIIIDRGQMVAMDSPRNLRERLSQNGRLWLRASHANKPQGSLKKVVEAVTGVASADLQADGIAITARAGIDVRARLAAAVLEAGWALLEIRPMAMSLEEIFIELTLNRRGK